MRFIHRFKQISAPIFVILMIVTQMLAPLIHAHGGYKEPARGFHMPGFEYLSSMDVPVDIGSTSDFQYAGPELIISVASGIESKQADDGAFDDHEIFALILFVFALVYFYFGRCPQFFPPNPSVHPVWARRPSRAPPQF